MEGKWGPWLTTVVQCDEKVWQQYADAPNAVVLRSSAIERTFFLEPVMSAVAHGKYGIIAVDARGMPLSELSRLKSLARGEEIDLVQCHHPVLTIQYRGMIVFKNIIV